MRHLFNVKNVFSIEADNAVDEATLDQGCNRVGSILISGLFGSLFLRVTSVNRNKLKPIDIWFVICKVKSADYEEISTNNLVSIS